MNPRHLRTTFVLAVCLAFLLSCGSTDTTDTTDMMPQVLIGMESVDSEIDELADLPITSPYNAIWILRTIERTDFQNILLTQDETFSLRYRDRHSENPGRLTGYTPCKFYFADSVNPRLILNIVFSDSSCSSSESANNEIEEIYRSTLELVNDFTLESNTLILKASNGDQLVFTPGYDKRLEQVPLKLVGENTQRIRFEETFRSTFDSAVLGEETFILTREMINEDILEIMNNLTSTPIYVFHDCPQITASSGSYFILLVNDTDGSGPVLYGAGSTCGTNLLGSRRFKKSNILELKAMTGQ